MTATAVNFNELPEGQYFTWRGKHYRKVPQGKALCLATDRILDFGFHNQCEPCDRPLPRSSLILQYLDWAMTQAFLDEQDRNVRLGLPVHQKVVVTFDLARRSTTTRWE